MAHSLLVLLPKYGTPSSCPFAKIWRTISMSFLPKYGAQSPCPFCQNMAHSLLVLSAKTWGTVLLSFLPKYGAQSPCPFKRWGTTDAEIKVHSAETLELLKAISVENSSDYSFACFPCCQEFHLSNLSLSLIHI